jgi:hypothetical protein
MTIGELPKSGRVDAAGQGLPPAPDVGSFGKE